MIFRICFVTVLLTGGILISSGLYAESGKNRPKIGVVLSGGGAKGFAHIALLRELERLGIPVDYIGGTSMGSVMAALYSLGYSVDELEAIARNTDWFSYFTNRSERNEKSLIQKSYFDEYILSIDMTGEGVSSPKGLINGHRVGLFLTRLTWKAHHIKDFNQLPIPFLCIATDIEKGEAVTIHRGNLVEALRASMAIPSMFEPVEIEGRLYIDGGTINNFPVKEVREMGADIIIGVDVSTNLYTRKELTSLSRVMEQTVNIQSSRVTAEQRQRCDILILPDINRFSPLDFHKTGEIIEEGEKAVRLQIDKLRQLSEVFGDYSAGPKISIIPPDEKKVIKIDRITLTGLKRVSVKLVTEYLDIRPGDSAGVDKIESGIKRLYGLNFFERINYTIETDSRGNELIVGFTEKPGNHLYLGFAYDSYLKAAITATLNINNLGLRNSDVIVKTRIGDYNKLDATYIIYTPFDPGIAFGINTQIYNLVFYRYENDKKIASFDFIQQSSQFSIGAFFSNWIMFSAGIKKEFYFIDADISYNTGQRKYKFDDTAFTANLKIDTMNSSIFPTKGILFDGELDYIRTDIGDVYSDLYAKKFTRYCFDMKLAVPAGRKIAIIAGFSTSIINNINSPPSYWFAMGGSQKYERWIYPLNGYDLMEKTGKDGWVYSINLQYEILKNLFVTAKWNEGKITDDFKELYKYNKTDAGYGLTLGYKFPFGPVEAGIFKKRDYNEYTFYFNMGFIY